MLRVTWLSHLEGWTRTRGAGLLAITLSSRFEKVAGIEYISIGISQLLRLFVGQKPCEILSDKLSFQVFFSHSTWNQTVVVIDSLCKAFNAVTGYQEPDCRLCQL